MKSKNLDIEELIKQAQSDLFGYILKRVFDPEFAKDILQETNLVIWKKAEDFTPGTSFTSWSFKIAHFQILSALQKKKKVTLVNNDKIIDSLISFEKEENSDFRKEALKECLKQLPPKSSELMNSHYFKKIKINDIADDWSKSPNAISKLIHRCRIVLMHCINRKLEESHG